MLLLAEFRARCRFLSAAAEVIWPYQHGKKSRESSDVSPHLTRFWDSLLQVVYVERRLQNTTGQSHGAKVLLEFFII